MRIPELILSLIVMLILPFSAKSQQFTDVTLASGTNFEHNVDGVDDSGIGSGGAWFDYNNDGNLDLYVNNRNGANKFFQNNGNGTFTDVAPALGIDDPGGDGCGVGVADLNNDGYLDLYLANVGNDKLYLNNSGNGFTDITVSSGLLVTGLRKGHSVSFGDYDNDGFLDIYVSHHERPGTQNDDDRKDYLLHNNGNLTFTDVSSLFNFDDRIGFGFIGGWTDYDRDGDLDIIVVNDCEPGPQFEYPTKIFRNDGGTDGVSDWTFTEVAVSVGIDDCRNGMGIAVGDYDKDGWLDVFYTNIGPVVLFDNEGGQFTDVSESAGVDDQDQLLYTWGATFVDYDLDGWQDLYVAAGNLEPTEPEDTPNLMFRNNGNGTFTDVAPALDLDDPGRSRNTIFGDYDNDGDLDVYVINYGGECRLYRNDANTSNNNYLQVRLDCEISNKDGIGALVKIKTNSGDKQIFEVRAGSNYGVVEEIGAFFGLGQDNLIDSLEVIFPSGIETVHTNVAVNQRIVITETQYWEGDINSDWDEPGNWALGFVPNPRAAVIVPSDVPNFPELNTDANLKLLHIETEAEMTILAANELTISNSAQGYTALKVDGDFENNGTLEINNTGNGGLVIGEFFAGQFNNFGIINAHDINSNGSDAAIQVITGSSELRNEIGGEINIYNTGQGEGIYAKNSSSIVNLGTINIGTQGQMFSNGIKLDGQVMFNNEVEGDINLETNNQIGLKLFGGSVNFNNMGTLSVLGGSMGVSIDSGSEFYNLMNSSCTFSDLNTAIQNEVGGVFINQQNASIDISDISQSAINNNLGSFQNFGSITFSENIDANCINNVGSGVFNNLSSGFIEGVGTIDAIGFNSEGTIAPGYSVGQFTFQGNYDHSTAKFQMEIFGNGGINQADGHDHIQANDVAILSGTLEVILVDFDPGNNDEYEIITCNTECSGSFDTEILPELGVGLEWEVQYNTNNVILKAIPTDIDSDNDGVLDANDNCPFVPNPDQEDTDMDGQGDACDGDDDDDGILDVMDNCSLVPNPDQEDSDDDGVGDACDDDNDNDGIPDDDDNCPMTANSNQLDNDNDGMGDVCDDDDDNDGVIDLEDNCQFVANSNQADNDMDGEGDACDDDDDNDGILDVDDNCPFTASSDQNDNDNDGMGDICDDDDDNDGILDVDDNCPFTANEMQEDTDMDGEGDACDADNDNDGVMDVDDNCPNQANPDQLDTDGDGLGDVCDSDDDNDGVVDEIDNCPLVQNEDQADGDGDGVGDVCEDDIDGDGILNADDNCIDIANEDQLDTDMDGIGDACDDDIDGDGILNADDNCPLTANMDQLDTDMDGEGDACDDDDDGDGVIDEEDNCPLVANEDQADIDEDGTGDICDMDNDNDGINDSEDNCPLVANEDQLDTDEDGEGNACDNDDDGDGVIDEEDNCPLTPNADQADMDEDGIGNLCDSDNDNDGVLDEEDNCPFVENVDQADNDEDGTGDLCDDDDDNDGITDEFDNCPFTSNETQADNDNDGIGDACDEDDDNDGVLDEEDNCPFTANADQLDTDEDGIGNTCDSDDDNDGVLDEEDNCPLNVNPDQADFDNDGLGDACDLDDDSDGIPDDEDNCPLSPNTDQLDTDEDGFGDICDSDDDNDGIADDVDNCPIIANASQMDTDSDGAGDACDEDDDNDGLLDEEDNCPLIVNVEQLDNDNDGMGDLCDNDDDNDGILDDKDNCPFEANPDQSDLDNDGIGDVCDATSILEIDTKEIKLYPNPSSFRLFIEYEGRISQYTISNIQGMKLIENSADHSDINIDVSSLSEGIYFLTIKNDLGQVGLKKFSIIR